MAGNESKGGQNADQNKDVREGFGDDMGTRVGRPDAPNTADRSMARMSDSVDDAPQREEGSILDDDSASSSRGARSSTRADGSSMEASARPGGSGGGGQTLDHTQRAESGTPQRGGASATTSSSGADSGMGGEANRGVHAEQGRGASVERGTDEGPAGNAAAGGASGSEPLEGRKSEHKPSYGGEGGSPRTSSDQREGGLDYYGDKGTKK